MVEDSGVYDGSMILRRVVGAEEEKDLSGSSRTPSFCMPLRTTKAVVQAQTAQ